MGLPSEWRSWRVVPRRLEYWAAKDPARPFLGCGSNVTAGTMLSYGQVHERSDALAGALAELGVDKGDRVAVVLPNRIEYVLAFFALAKLGAIQVPINPFLKGDFLRHQLGDSGTTLLIGDVPGVVRAAEVSDRLPDLRTLVCVEDTSDRPEGTLAFGELLAGGRAAPGRDLDPADLISVMYTSGTTGLPKGCMLSHGYYMALAWPWWESGWLREGDRRMTAMPFFHIGGQGIAMMPHLLAGDSVVFLDQFSASRHLEQAKLCEATIAFGVGPMGMALLATPPSEADRDHSLRLATFVPMAPSVHDGFEERFGVALLSENFGQTECNPISFAPLDRPASKRGSLGPETSALEVAVHDERGHAVPSGEVGEIVLRPREPLVMFSGYWNNPAATVEASRGLWHHTGDLGRVDDDGYFWFVDRKKDAMRRRGENISSMELEAAIVRHPKIAAVAVHAVPSPLGEDDVKACIVCAPGQSFEPAELHQFFGETLPYFAVPRYVEFLDELPLTPTNRVQKHELRARGIGDAWDFDALGLTIDKADRR